MPTRHGSLVGLDHMVDEVTTGVEPHVGYKKVLVTGGAGFIGSHVAEFLLERGDDVVTVDEMNDYYDVRIKENNLQQLRAKYPEEGRLKIFKADICDEDVMSKIFEEEGPTWVCHMAARAGVRPSIQDPYVYIHSNIKGTTHLMELSAKHGVKNFVFASSSSVYGGSKSTFFSEDEVVDNPFIDRVSRGVEIQQFGDGSSSRDYTFISDIVDGIVRALDRPHPYEVFNLGKGSGTSLKEFIDLVQKHTEKDAVIKVMPDQPGDVPYTCADVSKAHAMLGYKSKVAFEEGIRRTVKWYNGAYNAKELEVCPELQANGMGRAPSMVNLSQTC
ncbi:Bifunctional UDP-glucose 4-epimerase and UDP-xylose 4-epimerase [Seminavis robusta]|uniref:Bifunctional UDP-glucose 4-epimerase and UDP-xylose 4-epimerase n=1 Tax=Seminavis robusta TaxID=568900 RepID=A0A9N8HXV0_9STRA|nr:Bifunctional UDP-glucose 4-epimerase and UDP-xylose 4-epimerase [Seminavis robusta]|eukprot:Sro2318_g323090.1 Bifunctional UDP-glucose 4-epimerase and UDP-xylose 4-epimerase (330) ;mRNA; r:13504-14735